MRSLLGRSVNAQQKRAMDSYIILGHPGLHAKGFGNIATQLDMMVEPGINGLDSKAAHRGNRAGGNYQNIDV